MVAGLTGAQSQLGCHGIEAHHFRLPRSFIKAIAGACAVCIGPNGEFGRRGRQLWHCEEGVARGLVAASRLIMVVWSKIGTVPRWPSQKHPPRRLPANADVLVDVIGDLNTTRGGVWLGPGSVAASRP